MAAELAELIGWLATAGAISGKQATACVARVSAPGGGAQAVDARHPLSRSARARAAREDRRRCAADEDLR